jgi:AcrR family transcriptional regulator
MARQQSVEDGIADSALNLLRTRGPRAVTVEAVAAHSGIAKTTIYPRHVNRRDMLASALSRLPSPPPLDPETKAPDRLRWVIDHAVETIEDGIGLGGLAAMLTEDDREFTTIFRQLLVDQRSKVAVAIDAGKADGSMRKDVDPEVLIDAVVGAYIAEHARTGKVADGWRQRLIELLWPTVRLTPNPT